MKLHQWFFDCFFLCFLVIVSGSTSAQALKILTTKEGLPQSFISGLAQDNNGFIWIGTRNGLARYDGIQFKTFQHQLNDSTTLASNLIIWIYKDRQNQIWMEHESGELDRLNPQTEQIQHIAPAFFKEHTVPFIRRGWLVDADNTFWGILKTGGLKSYDIAQKRVNHYTRRSHGLPSDTLRGLLEDRKGQVWVLSQRGISAFHKPTNTFTHYPVPLALDFNYYVDNQKGMVALHERENGEIMWGDRKQLYFFHPRQHTFRQVLLPQLSIEGIHWIRTGPDKQEYLESNGTVFRYDDKNGLTTVWRKNENYLRHGQSFLVDRSGLIWIGTDAAGIHQIDLTTPYFRSFSNQKGFHLDLLKKEFKLPVSQVFDWQVDDEIFTPASYHFRSVYDQQKRLWLALKETVCYYDDQAKEYKTLPRVPISPENNKKEQGIGIKGITLNSAGAPIIVGYNGKILSYNPDKKQWQSLIDDQLIRRTFGNAVLPQDILYDNNRIWITTEAHGLLYLDIRSKKIHQLPHQATAGSLPTNRLLGLQPDPTRPELLWMGSYQGLICLNKKTLKCQVFSLAEGLPDNTVYSIQADQAGYLWFSTNKGLCRFHPVTHQLRIFQSSDGLPGDEFNRFHHLTLPDGRLAFGGVEGWTLFDPLAIKNDYSRPQIAFTNLKINNVPVIPGAKNRLLPVPLNALPKLTLTYEQNTLTFEFAGLQFNQPRDLFYRYQLLGYDDHWIAAGNTPVANYTKVPPGDYTLRINASNTAGQWSNHIREMQLIITPPWWKTWWAYAVYSLSLVGMVSLYMRYRINRRLLAGEIKLKEKEAQQLRELDEVKSRFFANITHDFRTPLTLILGPAQQLKTYFSSDQVQNGLAETIEKNAGQLLRLINQLMDMAKLEAKALKPQLHRGNPAETVHSVVSSFYNEAENSGIQLAYHNYSDGSIYEYAPDMLEKITYNLISNALKFTPTSGRISVELSAEPTAIKLIVQDTGVGIAAEKLPHIFERFYQAENAALGLPTSPQSSGTGIGLAFVKELVEIQDGTITVQSQPAAPGIAPTGTTFNVVLPYKKAAITEVEASSTLLPEHFQIEEKALFTSETEAVPLLLIVEDNAELAQFIMQSLSGPYQIKHAENGKLGLEAAFTFMPDLIISDVLMPEMDGFTMCHQLKEDLRTSHIPVVLLTAKVAQESRLEGLSQGADDYLTKPFYVPELLLRIKNLLLRQQKLRERLRQELSLAGSEPEEQEPAPLHIFIANLYNLLEEHLDDSLFGVDELATLANLSRTSLHRKIKALAGLSTSELIRHYRLKRAGEFLQQGYTSTEAAYMSGFNSPAYFTKNFREEYGVTPGEFIRNGNQPHLKQNL